MDGADTVYRMVVVGSDDAAAVSHGGAGERVGKIDAEKMRGDSADSSERVPILSV